MASDDDNVFYLNDTEIKRPTAFKVERYKLTKSSRLANGDMSMDYIASKHKFYLTWAALSGDELDAILSILWETSDVFFTFSFPYQGSQKEATIYVGSIPTELAKGGKPKEWVWKDVSFNLIEK